ncbi:MAG TPA: SDR family oxidoreductase [Candidatus Anaerostipes avistercoris]|uniref:SDR family oxidoreductase n=1 Tax=Candidatus Anaerostipes avistercoris TaxID=2838462 RepID=A0A9D2T8C7_9FIRM|nr:SDR family oxidoreductase [Candidatus Anaerostipes avistercoris]
MLREISLEGKTALVTGGGTGIGFAIAAEMADAGADVVIVGRREEKLREAAGKIGEKCTWRVFDVTETEKYDEFFEELEKKAPIDILVNNAGINIKKDYFDFTAEEFDKIMETQAKAPFMLSQTAAKYMKERKSGCILFISSLASILGMHEIQAYTVAKSGVKGLARSLARDLGPYGIRVNSLNPGFVYTDMLKNTNLKTPGRLEEIQNRTPMRGFAREKDLGMAAAFLASDAARFITGIDLVVDGGISSSFLI